MDKPEIAIRADGSIETGLGHIHRTLALGLYLKDLFSITFYCYEPNEVIVNLILSNNFQIIKLKEKDYWDAFIFSSLLTEKPIVVLDGYQFKTEYQEELIQLGLKVVVFDDLNSWKNVSDVVINHAYSGFKKDYQLSPHSLFCGGLKYLIVKPEILSGKNHSIKYSSENILICIGGTDPNNYLGQIIPELIENTNKIISLLTYPINPNFEKLKELATNHSSRLKLFHSLGTNQLVDLITSNDIAILQPSNIALEAAAIGISICLLKTAENQTFVNETLLINHCAIDINLNNLIEKLNSMNVNAINLQIENQKKLVDGKSISRVQGVFNSLLLSCRRINIDDAELIFNWSNDDVTRVNSYNQNKIEYTDHVFWFGNKVNNSSTCFLLFSFEKSPVGCVKIEIKETENVIGITLSPLSRGKKLAASILVMACKHFFIDTHHNRITAYIKINNIASLKGFKNAGFVVVDENVYFGVLSYKLILNKLEEY